MCILYLYTLYIYQIYIPYTSIYDRGQNLVVKEDPEAQCFYAEGLKERIVASAEEVLQCSSLERPSGGAACRTRGTTRCPRGVTVCSRCVWRARSRRRAAVGIVYLWSYGRDMYIS